jgi:hypothetical protein
VHFGVVVINRKEVETFMTECMTEKQIIDPVFALLASELFFLFFS